MSYEKFGQSEICYSVSEANQPQNKTQVKKVHCNYNIKTTKSKKQ